MIGDWHVMILDCPEPASLAAFYRELLGMVEMPSEYGDMVFIGKPGSGPGIAFQHAGDHVAPTWPDQEVPQQIHIDVRVGDLDEGERRVEALGAERLPGGGEAYRIFADPAGHPFCLVLV